MNFSLEARPWIYLFLGPFIGYVCWILYSMLYSSLVDSFFYSDVHEALAGLFVFVFLAYVVGAIPALVTGYITDFFARLLSNFFKKKLFRFVSSASIGFLVTISLLVLFSYLTNEMDEFSKVDPLSMWAISIYGAIAALISEGIYLKLGSPIRIE